MLKIIREKWAKYFIFVTLVAFVGLIFFGWGMEAYQAKQMDLNVGEINGKEIDYFHFVNVFERALAQETSESGDRSIMARKTVLERVWEEFISEHIHNEFVENNNITVSSAEVFEFMKMNPPPEIVNSPNFQTDGVFDTTKYHEHFLNNPEAMRQNIEFVRYMEHAYKDYLLKYKISLIVNAVPSMSKMEEEAYVRDNTVMGKFEYIRMSPHYVSDDLFEVTDEIIQREYRTNREDYKKGDRVNLKYLRLRKRPSSIDTAVVMRDLKEINERLEEGDDFFMLARDFTESENQDSIPGDLGFMRVDQMPPEILRAVGNIEVGQVTDVVKSPRGFFLYKLVDKKTEEDPFEEEEIEFFRLGEIFLSVRMGIDTEDSLRIYLEDVRADIESKSSSMLDYDFKETGNFELTSSMIPGVGFVDRTASFAYNADKGEFSDVFENDNSLFLFYLENKLPQGYLEFDEVKDQIAKELKEKKRKEAAENYIKRFYSEIEKGVPFDSIPKIDSLINYYSNEEFLTKYDFFPGAGTNNEFHAVSFRLQPGETAKTPVSNNQGAYIVKMVEMTHRDSTQIQMYQSQVKSVFRNKKESFFENWYEYMRESIDIEDKRHRFF